MIYQWVYGYSCWSRQKRPTDARTRGFGTFSWTQGLSIEEIEELERRCSAYDFPDEDGISPRPSADEIERLFPMAFYSFRLATGKRVIARTRYVGEGFYDHRWGAVIAHALVLDSGNWPRRPMEYADAEVFWKRLPESVTSVALRYLDDPNAPQPDYLPPLSFDDLVPSGNFSSERIAARFADPDLRRRLDALFGSFLGGRFDGQTLGVPDGRDVPVLFAGLLSALPRTISDELDVATRIPFVSSVTGGRPEYAIAGVPRRLALVDLGSDQGQQPDVKWMADVVVGETREYSQFEGNFTGIERQDFKPLVELYLFLDGRQHEFSPGRLDVLLKLLNEHGNEDVRRAFLVRLLNDPAVRPNPVPIGFLKDVYGLATFYDGLLSDCDDLFLAMRKNANGDVVGLFRKRVDEDDALAEKWLRDFALSDTSAVGILLTLTSLYALRRQSELGTGRWKGVFVPKEGTDWNLVLREVLARFPGAYPLVYAKCPDATAKQSVSDAMCSDVPSTVAYAMRLLKADARNAATDVVIRFAERQQGPDAYRQFVDALEAKDADFAKLVFSRTCSRLQMTDDVETLLGWYLAHADWLSDATEREAFLSKIEQAIPFLPQYRKDVLFQLEAFVSSLQSRARKPGRAEVILWYAKVISAAEVELSEGLADLRLAMLSLPVSDRRVILKHALTKAVAATSDADARISSDQQRVLIETLLTGLSEQDVGDAAATYVGQINCGSRKRQMHLTSVRLTALLRVSLGEIADERIRDAFLKEVATRIMSKFSEPDFSDMKRALSALPQGKFSSTETRRWDELCDYVREGRSVWRKVFRFFAGREV